MVETGRRQCLLFVAGGVGYAVEAGSVLEVATPDARGATVRGVLELRDLSALLGGKAEKRPGMAVVLDVSPTLAVRVETICEVADVAAAPVFSLPRAVAAAYQRFFPSALTHMGRLHLELAPDALVTEPGLVPPVPPELRLSDRVPDRALVFEVDGLKLGCALSVVSQVVEMGAAYCPLPGPSSVVVGLLPHARTLWPVYSSGCLAGREASGSASYLVLLEVAGHHVALTADRVLGVGAGFTRGSSPGWFRQRGEETLFLDLERMFS